MSFSSSRSIDSLDPPLISFLESLYVPLKLITAISPNFADLLLTGTIFANCCLDCSRAASIDLGSNLLLGISTVSPLDFFNFNLGATSV